MDYKRIKAEVLDRLGGRTGMILNTVSPEIIEDVCEIRIRAKLPLTLNLSNKFLYISQTGTIADEEHAYKPDSDEISGVFQALCQNSFYAYSEDIKNGFITIKGGHRIGIAGHIIQEFHTIKSVSDISSLNIRISRQVKGCCSEILPYIIRNHKDVYSTLIVSPPGCGKTTLIRDLARVLGTGWFNPNFQGANIGIVDERSEIAACSRGIPSNDVGLRTDVIDGCSKDKGIMMMLRSLAPDIIITDEIGSKGDADAIISAMNAGIRLIATAHGYSLDDLNGRKEILDMISHGVFEKYVLLSNKKGSGTVEDIIDGNTWRKAI